MKAAFVTKWTSAYPGREKASIALGRDVDDFFAKKAAEGICTEPKWFWAPTGEHLWFIEGEYEALLGFLALAEVQEFLIKGKVLIQGFGYDFYRVGREEMFEPYEKVLAELKV